ncbi:MAG: lysophospholipid acyltransferase family protein [Wenzhouxiangellaceae bacterium]
MLNKAGLARLVLHASAWLPLRVQHLVAFLVAGLVRLSGWRKFDIVKSNIALAFPQATPGEIDRMARANIREMLKTLLECGPAWHRDKTWIQQRIVAVHGRHHVDEPLQSGRGVLVLGGHLGNWELSILYGSLTLPIAYLYKPPRSTAVDRLLSRYRSRFGAEMIATGGAAMRRAVRKLRGGQALGMLFDQLPRGGDSVQAPFFGRPVATMTLPHRLIRATGCAVVMGHCLRVPGGWNIRFDPVPDADHPDPQVAIAAMNRVLDRVVRTAPEQYLWQYRRFQALPQRKPRPT